MFFHWTAGTLREKFANLFLSSQSINNDPISIYVRSGSDTLTEQSITWPSTVPFSTLSLWVNPQGTILVWNGKITSGGLTQYRIYDIDPLTRVLTERYSQLGTDTITSLSWNPAWAAPGGSQIPQFAMLLSGSLTQFFRTDNTYTEQALDVPYAPSTTDPNEADIAEIRFNDNGNYLAIMYGSNGNDQRLRIASRAGFDFAEVFRDTSTTYPTSLIRSMAYSKDGTLFAVTTDSLPYIHVYNVSGNSYSKLANSTFGVGNRPGGSGPVAWNPLGTSLAVGHENTLTSSDRTVTVYNRSGNTYTIVATLTVAGSPRDLKWSPDGQELLVQTQSAPYFYVFSRVNDTFTSVGTLSPSFGATPQSIIHYCPI